MIYGVLVWNRNARHFRINKSVFFGIQNIIERKNTATVADQKIEAVILYPNPVVSKLFLDLNNIANSTTIQIFSSEGKLILEQAVSKKESYQIDVEQWGKGVYFLKVCSEQDAEIISFIKY